MGSKDFETYRSKFIAAYNGNGGLDVIKPFTTTNCCFAVKGGNKLTVTNSKFGYMFPANTNTSGPVTTHHSSTRQVKPGVWNTGTGRVL